MSLAEKLNSAYSNDAAMDKRTKESNSERLQFIIDNPTLCHLFREFLRDNFCEENLAFWLEVQDFKREFNITSSASSAAFQRPPPERSTPAAGKVHTPGQQAMEQHYEALIQQAHAIYSMYLAKSSQAELNIDHGLRNELSAYLSEVMQGLTGTPFQGHIEADQLSSFNATHLHMMIRLYERIQTHVFRFRTQGLFSNVVCIALVADSCVCSSPKRHGSLRSGIRTKTLNSWTATCSI